MAQAGTENQEPSSKNQDQDLRNSPAPGSQSRNNSPAPSPSSLSHNSDPSRRFRHSLSPLDISSDGSLSQTNSPLSAHSYSSQSSFKHNASSGYSSGTS